MNVDKSRKLLCARKRLKEFQLNKKAHAQEKSLKNHDTSKKPLLHSNFIEVKNTQNQDNQNNIDDTEKMTTSIIMPNDTDVKYNDTEKQCPEPNATGDMADITEKVIFKDKQIENNESNERESLSSTGNIFINELTPSEKVDNDVYLYHEHDITVPESNEKTLTDILSSDPSLLQKEHLLQMASAVADVLTDNPQPNDTILDYDLNYSNKFLSSRLEEQKQIINQLHVQIAQYCSKISELEAILTTKDASADAKLIQEINPLKEQLQIHAQTTGILIAEKAELNAALTQSQITSKKNAEEIESLSGKLKCSQQRIAELEKELALVQSNTNDALRSAEQVQHNYNDLNYKYLELRKEKEDLALEKSELRQKLNLKSTELISAQQELEEKNALLALNELKLQQLTNTTQEIQTLEGQHYTVTMLEQQLVQMRETLKSVNDEKDEKSKQYQEYIRQLDTQHAKLLADFEDGKKVISDLETKEQNYIERISNLEQQLLGEKNRIQSLLPLENQKHHIDTLMKNIDELMLEQERLHISLTEKDNEIKALSKEIQDLRDTNDQHVEASKLALALESEQLGASRAVSQNHQLKQQLAEMHDAFVLLSNTKLDLTEQLQAERTIGKKLNAQLDKVETEVKQLKEQLKEREAQLLELEKEKLQNAQITDQIQHYQAQSHHAHALQEELQKALISIETLKKKNYQLTEKLNLNMMEENLATKETTDLNGDIQNENSRHEIHENNITVLQNNGVDYPVIKEDKLPLNINDSLKESEPFLKLEEKFKKTIEKVAELTDEKQRLEHLVLQLQGETETIGEYITLYQKQRAVLQERAKEKDQAFRQLLEQCNYQQDQLHKLKLLVTNLLKRKSDAPNSCDISSFDNKEITDFIEPKVEKRERDTELQPNVDDETTSQILDLLTEIKDCKDTCILEPNLHLCPWCSGKLITI